MRGSAGTCAAASAAAPPSYAAAASPHTERDARRLSAMGATSAVPSLLLHSAVALHRPFAGCPVAAADVSLHWPPIGCPIAAAEGSPHWPRAGRPFTAAQSRPCASCPNATAAVKPPPSTNFWPDLPKQLRSTAAIPSAKRRGAAASAGALLPLPGSLAALAASLGGVLNASVLSTTAEMCAPGRPAGPTRRAGACLSGGDAHASAARGRRRCRAVPPRDAAAGLLGCGGASAALPPPCPLTLHADDEDESAPSALPMCRSRTRVRQASSESSVPRRAARCRPPPVRVNCGSGCTAAAAARDATVGLLGSDCTGVAAPLTDAVLSRVNAWRPCGAALARDSACEPWREGVLDAYTQEGVLDDVWSLPSWCRKG
eukprot:364502-Chlamydomonas_euryale.AAC.9